MSMEKWIGILHFYEHIQRTHLQSPLAVLHRERICLHLRLLFLRLGLLDYVHLFRILFLLHSFFILYTRRKYSSVLSLHYGTSTLPVLSTNKEHGSVVGRCILLAREQRGTDLAGGAGGRAKQRLIGAKADRLCADRHQRTNDGL